MTPIEVLVYAGFLRRWTAFVSQVATDVRLEGSATLDVVLRLRDQGLLWQLDNGAWRAWTVRAPKGAGSSGSLGAARDTSSKEEVSRASYSYLGNLKTTSANSDAARRPRDPVPSYSRSSLLEAYRERRGSVQMQLAGLFITRWEEFYGVEYKPPHNYTRDVWAAEQVIVAESNVAMWCVEALFAKELGWLQSKTLEFLSNAAHRNKHVRHVAVQLMRAGTSTGAVPVVGAGYVNVPGGNR